MKHSLLLAGAALALASGALAAEKPAARPAAKAPAELHCAVETEHKVNVKEATAKKMFADYKGNRYFFCCAACPGAFKKSPERYAKGDHLPTPK